MKKKIIQISYISFVYWVLPKNIHMKQQMPFKIELWYKSDTDILGKNKNKKTSSNVLAALLNCWRVTLSFKDLLVSRFSFRRGLPTGLFFSSRVFMFLLSAGFVGVKFSTRGCRVGIWGCTSLVLLPRMRKFPSERRPGYEKNMLQVINIVQSRNGHHIHSSEQDCSNSSVLAMKSLQSCAEPSIYMCHFHNNGYSDMSSPCYQQEEFWLCNIKTVNHL